MSSKTAQALILLLLPLILLGGFGVAGENQELTVTPSVEVELGMTSPAGAAGGKVIPASCPSYEHTPGICGPACVGNVGASCSSSPNACGQTNPGYIQCNGACGTPHPSSNDSYGGWFGWSGADTCDGALSPFTCPDGANASCLDECDYASCGIWQSRFVTCSSSYSDVSAPPNPPGYGSACQSAPNACGQTSSGTITCSGTCSATTPSNPPGYGSACTSAPNACGQTNTGTIQCNGTCSAQFAPPNPSTYGNTCSGPANSCGLRNIGTIQCNGTCSAATAPSESLCTNINVDDACLNISADPTLTGPNGYSTLTWSASCGAGQVCTTYNMDNGAIVATSTSGSKSVGPHSVVTDYAFNCTASGNSYTDYVTVSPSNAGSGTFQEF